jgi:hypothetical protein
MRHLGDRQGFEVRRSADACLESPRPPYRELLGSRKLSHPGSPMLGHPRAVMLSRPERSAPASSSFGVGLPVDCVP